MHRHGERQNGGAQALGKEEQWGHRIPFWSIFRKSGHRFSVENATSENLKRCRISLKSEIGAQALGKEEQWGHRIPFWSIFRKSGHRFSVENATSENLKRCRISLKS